jgi:hypothetical protein
MTSQRPLVIPAKAGIQEAFMPGADSVWIPAFAGMTVGGLAA